MKNDLIAALIKARNPRLFDALMLVSEQAGRKALEALLTEMAAGAPTAKDDQVGRV